MQLSKQDPEILQKLIGNSLKSIQKYRKEFTAAANAGSRKNLDELIHKNKMIVHYIGAERLTGAVDHYRALLEASETHQTDLPEKKREVNMEFEEIIAGLEAIEPEDLS